MKKLKHKKIKNTGVLFELLSRKLSSQVMSGEKPTSLAILQKCFKESTELGKELSLYKMLLSEEVTSKEEAVTLVKAVLEAQKKLDRDKLNEEKYNIIKLIKKNCDVNTFFNTRIKDYTVYASIYNIFEHRVEESPVDYLKHRRTVVEHLSKAKKPEDGRLRDYLSEEDKELRKLVFKILIEKFNKRWSNLNNRQTTLIREYVNNSTDSLYFKKFISQEVNYIRSNLKTILEKRSIKDPSLVIKLKNIIPYLKLIGESRYIKESHMISLLRYYDLINELKDI